MPPVTDVFVNQAYLEVVESAANTLTFDKLETGISIHEKVGWIISRLDYWFVYDSTNFAASSDMVRFGISVTNTFTTPAPGENVVIDYNEVKRVDAGTPATSNLVIMPFTKEFGNLQGGGILVPPNPIYVYVQGVALTSAITMKARMFYTVRSLKTEDFWELVELRRMIGA